MENKNISLMSYTHKRDAHYKITADEIFNLINNYTDQEDLLGLYSYFDKKYQLPEHVIKQKIKQHLARSYLYKKGKFKSRLHIRNIPRYISLYGALIYALFFTKKNRKIENYTLIIDNIESPVEVLRFEKLLNLIGKDKVLFITGKNNISKNFPEYNFYNTRLFRNFISKDLLKSIVNELFVGIWVVLRASIKTKVNLFPISLQIIHSYLNFKSLFDSKKSQYIIQERHYDTNSVKNYLFIKSGGVASTSIQKNIIQLETMFFYVDIDCLFSLGKEGCERILNYGGRVKNITPVGSMFMEYYWFGKKTNNKKKYDIAILGINIVKERMDSYNDFMDDYYSLFRWMSKLSIENPNYNIVLIHHASAGEDYIENEILSCSNIEVLDKDVNSYKTAFSSKCAITFGSTMGYELNAHCLKTFFIDPGYRCSFLPELERRNDYINKMRITSYDDLNLLMNEIVSENNSKCIMQENSDMWCLESSEVSNRIYNHFINEKSV